MTVDQTINKLRRESFTPEQKARMAEANLKWRTANAEQVRKIHKAYYEKNRAWIAEKGKARRSRKVA